MNRNKGLNKEMIATILTLAWPTMLEQLMQTAVQYIDTAMVGVLGTQATAAVGATATVNWLVMGTVSALGVGFLSYIAQALGAGDREKASSATAQAALVTLTAGIFFTGLTLGVGSFIPTWMQVDESIRPMAGRYFLILYSPMLFRTATVIFGTLLRAAGDTRSPMRNGIMVNVLNVTLNFLLIYPTREISLWGWEFMMPGAGWGVEGAAAASAIAFAAGGIRITWVLWRHPLLSPRGQSWKPDRTILKTCMKTALPNMFQRFGTSLGYVAFASMVNSLGDTSTAAHTIANTVESAFYIPGYGMQTAAATLAGNAFGARDRKRLEDVANMFLPLEVALMTVSGAALFFLAPPLVQLFSKDPEVTRLGVTVLRMVAVSEPFYGFPIIMEGLMLGVGNTKKPFVYNILGMWGVRIVGTWICTQLLSFGLVSAWGCMIAHNLTLFVLFFLCWRGKRWNPLTAGGK